jgi:hypothetical protein
MSTPSFTRRTLLGGIGLGAGLLLARGLGVGLGGSTPARPFREVLRELGATLTERQRALLVLPADHPSRQIVNTIAVLDLPHLGTALSPAQLTLVRELCSGMLSPRGRRDFARTLAVEGRFEGCQLAIYGEPETGAAQAVLAGGHVMVRGGDGGESAPFGGGVAYGHQVGNHRWRVEGNSFAWHGDAANRLYRALAPEARSSAVLPKPPHELVLQVQTAGAEFPGVRIGTVSEAAREAASELLDTVFESFSEPESRAARASVAANGGLEALSFATYASHGFYPDMQSWASVEPGERRRRGDPYWQVWRVEGPGIVIHFQGHPHVHAYVNVVRDPARANLGESLGRTARPIEGDGMRRLLEAAMRRATGEALAWHGEEVPGRFCPGEITSGLAYALDPYGNRLVVASLEGRAMAAPLRERLEEGGPPIEPGRTYRVASTGYFAGHEDSFGEPAKLEKGDLLLRDALLAHLRAGALGGAA